MDNQILQVIARRRSTRAYETRQVPADALQAVMGAASSAPRAGMYPCQVTAVQDPALLAELQDAAREGARASGVPHLTELGENQHFACLYGAPALVIISMNDQSPAPQIDAAAMLENLLLAAESLDLSTCWVYFVLLAFQSPRGAQLLQQLGIQEGFTPQVAAALGYRAGEMPGKPEREPDILNIV